MHTNPIVEPEAPKETEVPKVDKAEEKERVGTCGEWAFNKYYKNSLLINFAAAILLAFAAPSVGLALAPDITAKWVAVIFIFILTGISLKTKALVKAFSNLKFNAAVQLFNLGILTIIVYYVSRVVISWGLSKSLGDGMVICAALPMTVNMVIVLTSAANGDEAAAVFNSAFGNFIGIFITPAWVLLLLGSSADIEFLPVILKLVYKVIIPLAFGQMLQRTKVKAFYAKYKPKIKKGQEACLTFIVYCVFCKTFKNGSEASVSDIFVMIGMQTFLLLAFKSFAWIYMAVLFQEEPELRVMGLFGCVHKTVAVGVPMLQAMFEGNPKLGMYTLPLLIWHPLQLLIGTIAAPHLAAWVDKRVAENEAKKKGESGRQIEMGMAQIATTSSV